jgi:hypothetical protein
MKSNQERATAKSTRLRKQRHWVLTHDVGDDTLTPMIIEAREEAEAPREAIITRNRQNGYGPDEDDSSAEETDVAASAV